MYPSRTGAESFWLFPLQARHQRRVGREDPKFPGPLTGHPREVPHLDRPRRVIRGHGRAVHQHVDVVARVAMEQDVPDPTDVGADAELLAELASERGLWRLAGLDFAAGKLPEKREILILAALRQEHFSRLILDESGDHELAIHSGLLGGYHTLTPCSAPPRLHVHMRLYSAKVPVISGELVRSLVDAGDIETQSSPEVELDVGSVLKEYIRVDRELTDKAKDVMEKRKLAYGQFGKIKRALAEEKEFGLGEDTLPWICNQLLETFMHSQHVDEVYADDATLRRRIKDVLKRHMAVDEELDAEVRQRIKNLEEGTSTWELEYNRVMEQIKQKHGLKE
jgi:uncharacterized protein